MQLKRLGLGIRFDFLNMVREDKVQRLVFEEIFSVLTLSDLLGLELYGGMEKAQHNGESIYMVVLMGGKLRRMRRIYDKLQQDSAIGMYLNHTQPFWENNRLSAINPPIYFGRVGKDGYLHGGDAELYLRVSKSLGSRSNIGKNISILLCPSNMLSVSALEAVKRLTFAARSSFPGVHIHPLPLMLGKGCASALVTAAKGSMRSIQLDGAAERMQFGVLRGKIAVIEAQESSYATGVAIRRALDEGLRTIYLTHFPFADKGMGCMRALGVKFYSVSGEVLDAPQHDMRVDAELIHPTIADTHFILMCSGKEDSLGQYAMELLNVKRQDAVEAMLDAVHFTRQLTNKALVITGGEDISAENSLGWRAMRSISRRCAAFRVPLVALTCYGWLDPDNRLRDPDDAVGVVKVPLSKDMSADEAGKVFDETAKRVFRFIRLGRDVEKIGAPKKEPLRIRYLPHQIKKRLISDETEHSEFLD